MTHRGTESELYDVTPLSHCLYIIYGDIQEVQVCYIRLFVFSVQRSNYRLSEIPSNVEVLVQVVLTLICSSLEQTDVTVKFVIRPL